MLILCTLFFCTQGTASTVVSRVFSWIRLAAAVGVFSLPHQLIVWSACQDFTGISNNESPAVSCDAWNTLGFLIWYCPVEETAKGRAMDSGFFVRDSSSSMAVLGGCYLGTPSVLVVASVVWLPGTGLISMTMVVSFSLCYYHYKFVTKTQAQFPRFLAQLVKELLMVETERLCDILLSFLTGFTM